MIVRDVVKSPQKIARMLADAILFIKSKGMYNEFEAFRRQRHMEALKKQKGKRNVL